MNTTFSSIPDGASYDVIVIGAGGAGMSAALFAAISGASVLIVEHTEYVGGTTALSAGTTWIPGTHHAAKVNPTDTLADAARYLTNAIGERTPAAIRQAFLENGGPAIQLIESSSDVKYRPCPKHPDYISDLDGATLNGRALEPLPFDGRLLGDLLNLIRPPIPEFTVLGKMMVDRTDINHLLGMRNSMASATHSAKILLRHAMDRLRYSRGTRLVMGNALIARLLYSLSKRSNVALSIQTSVSHIHRGSHGSTDGVESLTLTHNGANRTVHARGGIILASGGYNRSIELRKKMLPGMDMAWCPAAPGHTGAAQKLALDLGAHYGTGGLANTFMAPVSLRQRSDGSQAVFPHFVMDRAKPGMLTVNQQGNRFVNESTSYHLFALAMQQQAAFLICDAEALRKYGIGMVRPGGKGLTPFLADGYLTQADTLDQLAQKLGINGTNLLANVAKINAYAKTGIDPDFQRGVTDYQRNIGDANRNGSNPCLGALQTAPYYAVRLYPGDIGAATGLSTDENACVMDNNNHIITGLYAIGNDMHSIMGGVYTAPGITIGPGLVFGYQAARHAVARARTHAAQHTP